MSTIASDHKRVTTRHATSQHRRTEWSGPFLVVFLIVYAAINVADLLSTYVGLQRGLHEGNPLMGHLLASYGFSALIAYKLLVVGVVSCGVLVLRRAHPRVARITVVVCNLLVAGAVVLNLVQFMTLS